MKIESDKVHVNYAGTEALYLNRKSALNFKLVDSESSEKIDFKLKPFEIYEFKNKADHFKIINLANQITCLDWCPLFDSSSQFLALATSAIDKSEFSVKNVYASPNLIYFMKFDDLNSLKAPWAIFAISNKSIGFVSCLKWRHPVLTKEEPNVKDNFIGYLLAASSNGNAYIYYVEDLSLSEKRIIQTNNCVEEISVFEPKKQIILKCSYFCGQCTAADWSQLNGATQIAVGYSNGSVSLFQVNSGFLADQLNSNGGSVDKLNQMVVYPIQTFSAHLTFVKTLKWSKVNGNILATGSLFSREIKLIILNFLE